MTTRFRTHHIALALAILLPCTTVFACINAYEGTGVHRDHPPAGSHVLDLESRKDVRKHLRQSCEERLQRTESPGKTETFQQISDRGACEMYRGNYAVAVKLLERAEAMSKDEYIVAANLGTAYELNGDLTSALKWIATGIERNPSAHNRSEWLHVEILKARLALQSQPDWLRSHQVLGNRSPRSSTQPDIDHRNAIEEDRVKNALRYQLTERLQFVDPPDAVVADLLLDYGILLAKDATLGEGKYLFSLAKRFGADSDEVSRHQAYAQDRVDAHRFSVYLGRALPIAAMLLVAGLVLLPVIWFIRRRKKTGTANQ